MTRGEEVYQYVDSFRPERFLNADGTLNDDTMNYTFGFERRYVTFTPAYKGSHGLLTCRFCPG